MSLSNYNTFNVTLDDFYSGFQYTSGAWSMPDSSPRGFPNGDVFLSSLWEATYHETSTTGATVTVNFTSPAVYLYGLAGPSQGSYSVTVDAPDTFFGQQNTLSYTPHTLILKNLGSNGNAAAGNALLFDYALTPVALGATGSSLVNTTIDQMDQGVVYNGEWDSNDDTRFYGGNSSYTNGEGASVSFMFNGSAVYVFGDTVDDHGNFTIDLDGTTSTHDGYTPFLKFGTLNFFAANLDNKEHKMVITNHAGTGSIGKFYDIDSIVYTTPSEYAVASVQSSGGATSPTSSSPGSTPSTVTGGQSSARSERSGRTIWAGCVLVVVLSISLA